MSDDTRGSTLRARAQVEAAQAFAEGQKMEWEAMKVRMAIAETEQGRLRKALTGLLNASEAIMPYGGDTPRLIAAEERARVALSPGENA